MDDIHDVPPGTLIDDADPAHWAEAFIFETQVHPDLGTDPEGMSAWFALALLTGEKRGLHAADEMVGLLLRRCRRAQIYGTLALMVAAVVILLNVVRR